MKYLPKPIVVDAERWFPGKAISGVEITLDPAEPGKATIVTPEGPRAVAPGDWIITRTSASGKPERRTCKPDAFAVEYEPCPEQG